jgi:O-antigen biosynthesis protein WbqP
MYSRYLKRLLDVAVAGSSLVIFSPLMLLTAIAIRLDDGAPVFFRQKRVGRGGRLFEICKFRSLPANTGDIPSARAGALRPTRVGRVIRRTNIDELPQLFNILKGDMSVVGPRPALPAQVELVRMRDRNGAAGCKPGLTGLAQVNSYDGMPEEEKARFDGEYAARVAAAADLKIMLKTFAYLAKRPPVY